MAGERPLFILFVEDDPSDTNLAVRRLQKAGVLFSWARVDSALAMREALAANSPDVIITDYTMPGFSGLDAVAIAVQHDPLIPVIVLTGAPDDETAVSCLSPGVWDFMVKQHATRLPFSVREALARKRSMAEASAARQALIESEHRCRTLADSGRALIRVSGLRGTCEYVNRTWLEFRGRTLDQELGDGWQDGIHPDDRDRCVAASEAAVVRRQPFSLVYRLRRVDGQFRSIQEDGVPSYDTGGTFLGHINHCLDINDLLRARQDRNRLEAGLVQALKFEAAGRLTGGVAHDFNNLLTGILGYCDLLQSSMPPGSPDRADVEQIQAIATRGSSLTRQLLASSRKQSLEDSPFNLTTLVSDLRNPLQAIARESIDLVWDLAPDFDDVAGDRGQIEQALYKLVIHAMDAMPDGGRLVVRTSQAVLDDDFVSTHPGATSGKHVALSVTHTGGGIDPQVLPLVEPDIATNAPSEQTRPALAEVHGMVRHSGGYVAAESEVGRGSTFTMYFPRARDTGGPAQSAQTASAAEGRGAWTVLVVEDEADLRSMLRRVLEGHGYAVLDAADASEAVSIWEGAVGQIDLLLTDIVMPGRSGLEVARLFRDSRPGLPVLFMSGYTEPAVFKDLGLDDRTAIIQKPYLPSVLVERIRQVLDRGEPAHPGSRS